MYKISWKVSVVIVPPEWNNRVIRQSAFDLGGQLILLPICLNYFLWNGYKRQTEHFICSQVTISFFISCCCCLHFLHDAAFLCSELWKLVNEHRLRSSVQQHLKPHCGKLVLGDWWAVGCLEEMFFFNLVQMPSNFFLPCFLWSCHQFRSIFQRKVLIILKPGAFLV